MSFSSKSQLTLQSDKVGMGAIPDSGNNSGKSDETAEVLMQQGNVFWIYHTTVWIKEYLACKGQRRKEKENPNEYKILVLYILDKVLIYYFPFSADGQGMNTSLS